MRIERWGRNYNISQKHSSWVHPDNFLSFWEILNRAPKPNTEKSFPIVLTPKPTQKIKATNKMLHVPSFARFGFESQQKRSLTEYSDILMQNSFEQQSWREQKKSSPSSPHETWLWFWRISGLWTFLIDDNYAKYISGVWQNVYKKILYLRFLY